MAGLPEMIGLLHRADWTRLSLSAEVRFEQDGDLARRRENAVRTESMRRMGFRPGSPGRPDAEQAPDAEQDGYHRWRATLLIAPGRRYRLECEGDHGGQADGSDGEQAWTLRPPDPLPGPPLLPLGFEVVSGPPVPALFRPAGLLAGFTLDIGGPVTACGREAIAVTAVPRHGAVGSGTSLRPPACDRVELLVDAETGILLRREETFAGQLLALFELTTVTMSPPEANDPARFAPPAGSRPVRDPEDAPGRSGLGWQVAANAAGLAAGGLGAWLRLAPHLPGHRPAAEAGFMAAMPSPEPGPLAPADGSPPSDALLYRSGQYDGDDPQVCSAGVRRWNDANAMLGQAAGTFRAAGRGGVGYLLDTLAQNERVTLSTGQLRIGGPELYYLDYSSWQGRPGPFVRACDGEQYWGIHENRARVGPARPMTGDIASLVGSSWLLGERLSGGVEITYHGRRGYHLRVTRGDGAAQAGPTMIYPAFYPADAIVDAETGCLLRLIAYGGDGPAEWWELDDVTAAPGDTADPAGFRPHIPPGTRVVEETGNPLIDATMGVPGLTGTVGRTAAEVFRCGADAVSTARSFLDDLRGHR